MSIVTIITKLTFLRVFQSRIHLKMPELVHLRMNPNVTQKRDWASPRNAENFEKELLIRKAFDEPLSRLPVAR